MEKESISKIYARGLFWSVREDQYDLVLEEMQLVNQLFNDHEGMVAYFGAPLIADENKKSALERIINDNTELMPEVVSFLFVLLARDRLVLVDTITKALSDIIDDVRNINSAIVRVAFDPSDEDRRRITEKVEQLSGKKLRCEINHDPTLISGIVAKVGHVIYDLSMSSKLNNIAASLTNSV